jgi:DNA-binding transcriptional MerR regulator
VSEQIQERALRIGEVAARVGVTPRTIRYYEERGLLGRDADRSKGAHRAYTEADVVRLRELIRLRDLLGLSLDTLVELAEADEARAVLRGRWEDTSVAAERLRILDDAIPLVRRQIGLLSVRRSKLDAFAGQLRERLASLEELRKQLTTR